MQDTWSAEVRMRCEGLRRKPPTRAPSQGQLGGGSLKLKDVGTTLA